MAEPRRLNQVRTILILTTMCCLVFLRSSSAPAKPALPPSTLCVPRERDALLALKAGLTDPGNYLSSWQGQDCCRWTGVGCSNRTGHVVKLQINSCSSYQDYTGSIGGEISSSLLTLRHLKHLDLSWNNFGGRPIPELIGALGSLRDLDLSNSNFGGRIPPHLGNLSNLLSLRLQNILQTTSHSPDLAWVSRLRKLQYLGMSEVDLSAAIDWAHAVNMLPSLVTLDLSYCGLQNTMPPPLRSNLSSLELLYLDFNSFNSSIGAKSLFWGLPSVQEISLFGCGIHGPIPDAVGNLTTLQRLYLHQNHFTGVVPSTFNNLKKLQQLQLSDNFINMDITELFHRLPEDELQNLYLDNNNLTGSLPARLEYFSSLTTIWLNNNKLSGEIPVGIRDLTNLKELRLNANNLHGTITEDHFANLTSLEVLWISDNSLTMLVNNTWNTPFRLTSAGFSSCMLGPIFPAWLCQPIDTLDISNTSIHDSIPGEFWIGTYRARYLDLSRNQLVGKLPTEFLFGGLEAVTLDISFNQLVGPIPTLPKNLAYLDLSGNNLSGALPSDIGAPMLVVLVLFKNSISGTIPCSLFQLQQLKFLDLSENLLNGTLPKCFRGSKTSNITMLNLNNNNLSGTFPSFVQRCNELKFLDLAYNNFSGSIPTWIGEKLPYLAFLRLRSNMFSGGIPVQLTRMKGLQYLDLACNNISGDIPQSLGSLVAMARTPDEHDALFQIVEFGLGTMDMYIAAYTDSLLVVTKGQQLEFTTGIAYMVNIDLSCNSLTGQIPEEISMLIALKNLNLSWNHLSGRIPQSIGELRELESFDLSHNELSGVIPTSLSALTSLSHLNLSYNHLTGKIPSGNQLRTLGDQASIYIGNPGLCGPPLQKNCSGAGITPHAPEEHKGMSDAVSFYLGMGIGCVVGLWIVFCAFLFYRKWRFVCFLFADRLYYWVGAQVQGSWGSMKRRTGRS